MNSLDELWQSLLEKLGERMSPTAQAIWFSDCKPLELGDRTLVIQVPTEFRRSQIQQRFLTQMCQSLTEIFSCEFNVVMLVGDEVEEYQSRAPSDDSLPEALAYTFDRFIVGQSNKFAHACAVAVANNPGQVYNPLFIYGNSGLGKTHLLLAIGQAIREKAAERSQPVKIGYIKGDDFTTELVQAIQDRTQEQFRQKYRSLDLFLVDDIQFISGREAFQLEFFHTFEALYQKQKQIVITSDRPPLEIASLEDRLRSRFEGGLLADIQPPDVETRMAIIRSKAEALGFYLSDDVVSTIAKKVTANIRQLEGVIHKLLAIQYLEGPISVDSVEKAVEDVIRTGIYIPTPEAIIGETGRYFNISSEEIRGQRRSKNTSLARQVAMYLIRTLTSLSLEDIGKEFDHRNHSTVLSSIRKVEDLMKTDTELSGIIRDITSNLNSAHDR